MTSLTNQFRFFNLVAAYVNGPALAVEVDALDILDCALAVPPGVVPTLPRLGGLARDFVHAMACDDPSDLPPGLKDHVEGWMAASVV